MYKYAKHDPLVKLDTCPGNDFFCIGPVSGISYIYV
jgi:hypothetical protein